MHRSVLFALVIAVPVLAQDYFPLQLGNQWIYRTSAFGNTGSIVVEVAGQETINNQVYAVVRGLPEGDVRLRQTADGTLYALNPDSKQESVWAVFSTAPGGSYNTSIHPCDQSAQVVSKNSDVKVPAGNYSGALELAYTLKCADAGITGEKYLPWIGLAERTYTSIAGPRVMSLAYSRTGEITVLSAPEQAFTLTIDRSRYGGASGAKNMTVRMTLRNTQQSPIQLVWPSSQRYDIEIRNEKAESVYTWSAARAFSMLFGAESFGPGERNYAVDVPLQIPPGKYTVTGWLTNDGPPRFSATMPFEME